MALLLIPTLATGCATATGTMRYQLDAFPESVKNTVPMRNCEATIRRDDTGAWTVTWATFTDAGKASGLYDYTITSLLVDLGDNTTATLDRFNNQDDTAGVSVQLSKQNCQHFFVSGSVDTHNKVRVRVELECHVRPGEWIVGNASSDDCEVSQGML